MSGTEAAEATTAVRIYILLYSHEYRETAAEAREPRPFRKVRPREPMELGLELLGKLIER